VSRWLRLAALVIGLVGLMPAVAAAQWETPNRSFHKEPVFPLEGSHLSVPCADCHVDGQTLGTPTTCVDCHWNRRQDDPFRTRLGMACEQCHRESSWTAVRWDHTAATGTRLNLAHEMLACSTCHTDNLAAPANLTCETCHVDDYARTSTPNHLAAGFPTDCEVCHQPADADFSLGRFDHRASYALVGAHAITDCASCHEDGVYLGTPHTCVGCHQTDYDRTTTPNHAEAGYSLDCESCHRPTDPSFRGATFNHTSVFPLVGLHATVTCVSCHANQVYAGTLRDCVGCHQTDYDRTTAPNHAAAGYSLNCESCHRPTDAGFRGASVDHAGIFPLLGVHATIDCATCHVNDVFTGTPRTCVGCHQTDYDRTTDPAHAAAGFGLQCDTCHRSTDVSWGSGTGFDHNDVFLLVGRHVAASCVACHTNGVYAATPQTCVGCHQADYDRTTSPAHAAAGFPLDCESCHRDTDASWGSGTGFDHNQVFQLVGRHAAASCVACHANGVYTGTPQTCVSCHLDEYQQTTDPSHVATGFPTTCESCHQAADASWGQGRFVHSWFPIASGRHSGNECSACHQNPANFVQFSCTTGCHGRSETDSHHREENGYAYDSNLCYACHPTGRGD